MVPCDIWTLEHQFKIVRAYFYWAIVLVHLNNICSLSPVWSQFLQGVTSQKDTSENIHWHLRKPIYFVHRTVYLFGRSPSLLQNGRTSSERALIKFIGQGFLQIRIRCDGELILYLSVLPCQHSINMGWIFLYWHSSPSALIVSCVMRMRRWQSDPMRDAFGTDTRSACRSHTGLTQNKEEWLDEENRGIQYGPSSLALYIDCDPISWVSSKGAQRMWNRVINEASVASLKLQLCFQSQKYWSFRQTSYTPDALTRLYSYFKDLFTEICD